VVALHAVMQPATAARRRTGTWGRFFSAQCCAIANTSCHTCVLGQDSSRTVHTADAGRGGCKAYCNPISWATGGVPLWLWWRGEQAHLSCVCCMPWGMSTGQAALQSRVRRPASIAVQAAAGAPYVFLFDVTSSTICSWYCARFGIWLGTCGLCLHDCRWCLCSTTHVVMPYDALLEH
jgi:hypothetical protein